MPRSPERTPAAVRRMTKRRVLRVDPAAQRKRHQQAVRDRSVYLHLLGDGMAELGAYLPAGDALRCRAAIEAAAQARPDTGDGIDARRADALTGLLTRDQAPAVELTLRATDREPVTIPGLGPIDADTVNDLLTTAAKVLIRPLGNPPAPSHTHRPSAGLDRWIRAHDPTCRFPGCTVKAKDCDLDHVIPWHRGGKTRAGNLMPLCRKDHRLKTFHNWTPVLNPDRSVTWTDPLGHKHEVPPPDS